MKEYTGKFRKAWDNVNSQPIDIIDLPKSRNGGRCNCICVECKEPLEACQGFVKAWYFRHQSKTNCKGGPMTALHLMAQYLLIGNRTIKTIDGDVSYSNGVMEFVLPNSKYEVDVAGVKVDASNFVIEIFVKHHIEREKIEFIMGQKIHCIEIDLSNVNPDIRKEVLVNLLLNDTSIQRIIYSPNKVIQPIPNLVVESVDRPKSWFEAVVPIALFLGVCYWCYRIIKKRIMW